VDPRKGTSHYIPSPFQVFSLQSEVILSLANGFPGTEENKIQAFGCHILNSVLGVFILVIYCDTKRRKRGLVFTTSLVLVVML
jgi:hypothetical protein